MLAETDAAVSELKALVPTVRSGTFTVLKCVYDTNKVAIIKGRRVYRVSNEVDFNRVLVITVDHQGDYGRIQSYGPIYVAVPEKPPEQNVTRSVIQHALQDSGLGG